MRIRTSSELINSIRGRRLDLGLTQREVAQRLGVSRKWLNQFELGKARADIETLVRLTDLLGLEMAISTSQESRRAPKTGPTDLDLIISRHGRHD